ncbi:3924_t:CDS:2 [Paraglomus occultum]|uniref:3924_t:CDS:1 n=1 Tax=Paraglomus occultum TaxID=144539 RepID=A0A9N9GV86_9GLOM|nr:3924_t:CDS:2 [Paraglomus occultum]
MTDTTVKTAAKMTATKTTMSSTTIYRITTTKATVKLSIYGPSTTATITTKTTVVSTGTNTNTEPATTTTTRATNTYLPVMSFGSSPSPSQPPTLSISSLDKRGSASIYVTGSISAFVNVIGCSAILIMTYHKSEGRLLSSTQRYPTYMAVLDALTGLVCLPNLLYPMTNDRLIPSGACVAIGFVTSLLIIINMLLMAVVAVIVFHRVCKGTLITFGAWDWKLFLKLLVPSLLIGFIALGLGGFGPDVFWCFIFRAAPGSRWILISTIIIAYVVTGITTASYLLVIRRIHRLEPMLTTTAFADALRRQRTSSTLNGNQTPSGPFRRTYERVSAVFAPTLSSRASFYFSKSLASQNGLVYPTSPRFENNDSLNEPTFEQKKIAATVSRATRKMSYYLFVQFIQYTPVILFCMVTLIRDPPAWIYVLTITLLNLGGVLKAHAFLCNEKYKIFQKDGVDTEKKGIIPQPDVQPPIAAATATINNDQLLQLPTQESTPSTPTPERLLQRSLSLPSSSGQPDTRSPPQQETIDNPFEPTNSFEPSPFKPVPPNFLTDDVWLFNRLESNMAEPEDGLDSEELDGLIPIVFSPSDESPKDNILQDSSTKSSSSKIKSPPAARTRRPLVDSEMMLPLYIRDGSPSKHMDVNVTVTRPLSSILTNVVWNIKNDDENNRDTGAGTGMGMESVIREEKNYSSGDEEAIDPFLYAVEIND